MTLWIDFFSIVNPIGQMINFSVCNQTVIIPIISLPKKQTSDTRRFLADGADMWTVQIGAELTFLVVDT